MRKIKVGLVFGGKSAEHAISLKSTAAIFKHLDREKYDPSLIYINRMGEWAPTRDISFIEESYQKEKFLPFLPWNAIAVTSLGMDIYFPVLHGPNGEDGRIQGLFELAGVPFVGANSLSSVLAMDKIVSKTLFKNAGLKQADWLYFVLNDHQHIAELVAKRLSWPVFVKPCSLGSSVGITKVSDPSRLPAAVDLAFSYDRKILVERAVDMREIEIAVMGNEQVMISRPGELIPFKEFYDYEDKYLLGKTQFSIPADLDPETEKDIKRVALKSYRALFLNGMARIDLFLEKNSGQVYINEINTIPGFTEISMFPKLWNLEGIGFNELLTRLIDYGMDYHQKTKVNVHEDPGN